MPRDRKSYDGDVYYEVWRSGGNPDRVDPDRLDDYRWNGVEPETAARRELTRQRPQHEDEGPGWDWPDEA